MPHRAPLVGLLALVASATVVGGCSTSADGTPTSVAPTGSSMPPSSSAAPGTTSSAVPLESLDLSNDQLCQLLSSAQTQQLGSEPTGKSTTNVTTGFPVCSWNGKTNILISFTSQYTTKELKKPAGGSVQPYRLDGLSGVIVDNPTDPPLCQVGLDLSDHSMIIFGAGLDDDNSKSKRCGAAEKMAEFVVPELRSG